MIMVINTWLDDLQNVFPQKTSMSFEQPKIFYKYMPNEMWTLSKALNKLISEHKFSVNTSLLPNVSFNDQTSYKLSLLFYLFLHNKHL